MITRKYTNVKIIYTCSFSSYYSYRVDCLLQHKAQCSICSYHSYILELIVLIFIHITLKYSFWDHDYCSIYFELSIPNRFCTYNGQQAAFA